MFIVPQDIAHGLFTIQHYCIPSSARLTPGGMKKKETTEKIVSFIRLYLRPFLTTMVIGGTI